MTTSRLVPNLRTWSRPIRRRSVRIRRSVSRRAGGRRRAHTYGRAPAPHRPPGLPDDPFPDPGRPSTDETDRSLVAGRGDPRQHVLPEAARRWHRPSGDDQGSCRTGAVERGGRTGRSASCGDRDGRCARCVERPEQPRTPGSGAGTVSRVLPICFPASDVIFGERVRRVIAHNRWDLQSPEGIALMQAVLRRSYPMATVLREVQTLDGGWQPTRIVAVHRDGRRGSIRANVVVQDGPGAIQRHGRGRHDR